MQERTAEKLAVKTVKNKSEQKKENEIVESDKKIEIGWFKEKHEELEIEEREEKR